MLSAGDEPARKHKEKRKPTGGGQTLEANADNLNVKRFDSEFSEDPIFRKTSAAFDEGGARGLLLNHLHVHHACELIFDSSDAATGGANDNDNEEAAAAVAAGGPDYTLDVAVPLRGLLAGAGSAAHVRQLELCPTLAGFDFGEQPGDSMHMVEQADALPAEALFGGDDDDLDAAGDGFADDVAAQEAHLLDAIREACIAVCGCV